MTVLSVCASRYTGKERDPRIRPGLLWPRALASAETGKRLWFVVLLLYAADFGHAWARVQEAGEVVHGGFGTDRIDFHAPVLEIAGPAGEP